MHPVRHRLGHALAEQPLDDVWLAGAEDHQIGAAFLGDLGQRLGRVSDAGAYSAW